MTDQPDVGPVLEVRYLAELQDVAGCSGEPVPAAAAPTLRALISELARSHGEPMRNRILDTTGTELADGIFVLVNGRHMSQLAGLDAPLAAGDTISLVPVIEFG